MNNKPELQSTAGAEGKRSRALTNTRSGEKKHRASFLVVDIFLLIGVIGVIFLLLLAFTPLDLNGKDTEPRQIVYTIEFFGVEKDMEHAFREGDPVIDMQTGATLGVITQVSSRVYETYTDIPSDDLDPEFDKYVVQTQRNEEWRVITLTVQATAEYESGVGYTVEAQRIAVGREYQLRFPSYTHRGVCISLRTTEEGTVGN